MMATIAVTKAKVLRSFYISCFAVVLVALGWSAYAAVNYFHTSPRYEVQRVAVSGLLPPDMFARRQ